MMKSNLFASLKSWRNSCLVLAGNIPKIDLSFYTFQTKYQAACEDLFFIPVFTSLWGLFQFQLKVCYSLGIHDHARIWLDQAVSVSCRSGVNVLLIIVKPHNNEPTMCEPFRQTSNKYNKYDYGKCRLHLSMSIIRQINRLPWLWETGFAICCYFI